MKWIENGISFDGTPEEFLAVHKNAPAFRAEKIELSEADKLRTRSGRSVAVRDPNGEVKNFKSILSASEHLRTICGIVVTSDKISHEIIKFGKCIVSGYEISRLEEDKTEELKLERKENHD